MHKQTIKTTSTEQTKKQINNYGTPVKQIHRQTIKSNSNWTNGQANKQLRNWKNNPKKLQLKNRTNKQATEQENKRNPIKQSNKQEKVNKGTEQTQ